MSLKEKITHDMHDAMRAHEKERLGAIRLLNSAIRQKEIDEQIVADDAIIQQIITKLVKERRDSVEQYKAGGREDLANKEAFEIQVLSVYLPKQLSDSEIEAIVDQVIAENNFSGMAAMGKAIGLIKPKVMGRADMGRVSALVKSKLCK